MEAMCERPIGILRALVASYQGLSRFKPLRLRLSRWWPDGRTEEFVQDGEQRGRASSAEPEIGRWVPTGLGDVTPGEAKGPQGAVYESVRPRA